MADSGLRGDMRSYAPFCTKNGRTVLRWWAELDSLGSDLVVRVRNPEINNSEKDLDGPVSCLSGPGGTRIHKALQRSKSKD